MARVVAPESMGRGAEIGCQERFRVLAQGRWEAGRLMSLQG